MLKRFGWLALFAELVSGCHNCNSAGISSGNTSTGTGGSSGQSAATGTSAGSASTTGGGGSSTTGGSSATGGTTATAGGTTTSGGTSGCGAPTSGVDCSNCPAGDFCDTTVLACCMSFPSGKIDVDGVVGNDATGCCGLGTNCPCQTLFRAMALIDTAAAKDVRINATVDGGGGDWTPAGEKYPIVLGWGVELSAPGVFFLDPDGGGQNDLLRVAHYSKNDTVGYASLVGAPGNPVGIGMNAASTLQTADQSAIAVSLGSTLYVANASVNGNATDFTSGAILVGGGATLWLGQDRSGSIIGTVAIGNALGRTTTDGTVGIRCAYDPIHDAGCTIRDATMAAGQSSVVIQGQELGDIMAEDLADIFLTSSPVIGIRPTATGFGNCPSKKDYGVWLVGPSTVTLRNATLQCITHVGLGLRASQLLSGVPSLIIDGALIQNTDLGIYASAGTARVSSSTIRYNVVGVEQATDGVNNGTLDLSGGGNSVICSSGSEDSLGSGGTGIDVLNISTANLNASNVAWDTANADAGPDYFKCDPSLTVCSCLLGSCTTGAGHDDMDAVTIDAGITRSGAKQSPGGCP
jgi:hypothetical protein